jgi:hypothetical protein
LESSSTRISLIRCLSSLHQTKSFSAALLVKSGKVMDDVWDRAPTPLVLNADTDLAGTNDDLIKYLSLRNIVSSFSVSKTGEPWCGSREKSDVFMQILIEACSNEGTVVVDLSALTGTSFRACRASGRHFVGLERDKRIFDELLKPLVKVDVLPVELLRKRRGIPSGAV